MSHNYNMPVASQIQSGNPIFKGNGSSVFNVSGNATLAEINAGKTILEGVTGVQLRVVNIWLKSNGAFAALTSIQIQESDGSPVIATYTQAALTDGAQFNIRTTISGQTAGAGFNAALTSGNGVRIIKVGSDATTATSVDYLIEFTLVE